MPLNSADLVNTSPAKVVHIPDEIIHNILSRLPVKDLTRLRCVAKSFNTIISDSSFVKLHLQSSIQNPQLLLQWVHIFGEDFTIVPYLVRSLVENRTITVVNNSKIIVQSGLEIVGSCNGLICLTGFSLTDEIQEGWIHFWNPATKLMSDRLGIFPTRTNFFNCSFGFDNSTNPYKVMMFDLFGEDENDEEDDDPQARIFTLGDNNWIDIPDFPTNICEGLGVYLSSTFNWLAKYVIVSLDLGTKTCNDILLPLGFNEVPRVKPQVVVLMDCLCFCHDSNGTHFVIWQMKEFKVKDSWIQQIKVSYQDLHMNPIDDNYEHRFQLSPLCLFDGHTFMFASIDENQAIVYNKRDDRVERTIITNEDIWWLFSMTYVESLVSPN